MKKINSTSARETELFAADLAKKIEKRPGGKAFVIALSGNLGAGKTTFTKGFSKSLGIRRRTASPTFIVFRRYALGRTPWNNLYHVDAYRLKKGKDLLDLGFKKVLDDPRNIILIEWPEKIRRIIPKSAIWIEFSHGAKENERTITIRR